MINKGLIYILLACFLWGLDTLIRYPLVFSGKSVLQIVFWEHLILTLIFSFKGKSFFSKLNKKKFFLFFLLGAGGSALATLLFTKAFSLAHPTLVILIQKFQPLFALFLARYWLGERLPSRFLVMSSIALVGAVIMIAHDLISFDFKGYNFRESQQIIGYFYALVAAILWGGATVLGRYLSLEKFTPSEMTFGRVLWASVVLIPFVIMGKESFSFLNKPYILGQVLLMSVLSGVLGLSFYYHGLKKVKAKLATIAEMSFPVWVIGINWLFLDKTLNFYQLLGAFILLGAIFYLQKPRQEVST